MELLQKNMPFTWGKQFLPNWGEGDLLVTHFFGKANNHNLLWGLQVVIGHSEVWGKMA